MKSKFTYFKNTGKYYSEGEGILPNNFGWTYYSKEDLVKLNGNRAPGLSFHGYDLIWLVEEENGVPRLLVELDSKRKNDCA